MQNKIDPYKRGFIEMTASTFRKYKRYMKRMPQFKLTELFYTSYPVKNANAKEDVIVLPNGMRKALCF